MPKQMFENMLEPLKGWFDSHALTIVAPLSSNITLDEVPAGRVAHLNSSKEFELGAIAGQMPIFLRGASTDPDAVNDGEGSTKPYGWTAAQPDDSPTIGGLVATGAFEIATTEFDDVATYAPNDYLHAPTEAQCTADDGAAVIHAGKLFKDKTYATGGGSLTLYTNNICGVVSTGEYESHWKGVKLLAFWPVYLPGTA